MLRATLNLDMQCDCILSRLAESVDSTFTATYEEVVDDDHVTFLLVAGDHASHFEERLNADASVRSVKRVGPDRLLVTKRSCGAIPAIRRNHGILQGMDKVHGDLRTFEIVVFTRADLRAIVSELQELGTVSLESLKPVASPSSRLSTRQAEALQAAVEAGYFEWPRRTDAKTIAAELGISHPTFLEHLRKGERKLLSEALAETEPLEPTPRAP